VAASALKLLETPGGLRTSDRQSGNQWDSPFGWAPLQTVAVRGLWRYGLKEDAERVAVKFLSLVLKEHIEHRAIFEKYDVVRRESAVSEGIQFGYSSNEIGFGWTNAAFVDLWRDLPAKGRREVMRVR
jgi:alpha,alpha-trehalase